MGAVMASGDQTVDSVCRGLLTLAQPCRGYRFNIDSIILADFAASVCESPPAVVMDLGAGCGVVGLILARRWPRSRVVLVELQKELAGLAEENARRNGLEDRVEIIEADLKASSFEQRSLCPSQLVVSNPPFFRSGHGRVSDNRQVALAKHEIECRLQDVVTVAARGLAAGGLLAMISAANRIVEIRRSLAECQLSLHTVREVCPLPDRDCNRVLVGAVKGEVEAERRLSPLVVQDRPGDYSPELRRMLGDTENERGSND